MSQLAILETIANLKKKKRQIEDDGESARPAPSLTA